MARALTDIEKEEYERLVEGSTQITFDLNATGRGFLFSPELAIAADMHTHTIASGHAWP